MNKTVKMLLKALIVAWVISGFLMVISAFIMYMAMLDDSKGDVFSKLIYIVASLAAGVVAGKTMKIQKFIWGIATGGIYFISIILLSMIINGFSLEITPEVLGCVGCCIIGGMFGGMIS